MPFPAAARRVATALCLLALAGVAACTVTDPLTEPFVERAPITTQRVYSFPPGILDKVAVLPFYPDYVQSNEREQRGVTPTDAAAQVARAVVEALTRRGIATVAPSDLNDAFALQGVPTPRLDAIAAGDLAAREFGATSVLIGKVTRYRERAGASRGASVSFEITLHSAPDGKKAWVSSFDETQRALSENLINARRYPDGGTRWLSAAELASWGADAAIDSLPKRR